MQHVDDYLDGPSPDPIAKEFLEHARRPAVGKDHAWLRDNTPLVTWKGQDYYCVGASRLGDVWLRRSREQLTGAFYEHRVDIDDLSNWRKP